MQTFLISPVPSETASALDRQRLGKQRVEAIQIARTLLGLGKGWEHHPAVRMWVGYEHFLVDIYLESMMVEWVARGYRNTACAEHAIALKRALLLKGDELLTPTWFSEELFQSHKSNLIRKNPKHYGPLFPGVSDDLPYVWPV